jgi:hypothetical protein
MLGRDQTGLQLVVSSNDQVVSNPPSDATVDEYVSAYLIGIIVVLLW